MSDNGSLLLGVAESTLSTTGKLFFAGLAGWVLGESAGLKIRASSEQADALTSALLESRRFMEELDKPGATVESVIERLRLKNASAVEFERITGVRWPL